MSRPDETVTSELILAACAAAAEAVGDLVEPVYALYFARDPAAAALMAHMDHLTRGRMLTEVLRLLMEWNPDADRSYLDFEVRNHQWAYRVEPAMYAHLLGAIRDVVAEAAGSAWNDAVAGAWAHRIGVLEVEIAPRAAATSAPALAG